MGRRTSSATAGELTRALVGNRQDAHLFREFSRGWDKLQETVQQNMTYKATR
jgi:hypothetical protein